MQRVSTRLPTRDCCLPWIEVLPATVALPTQCRPVVFQSPVIEPILDYGTYTIVESILSRIRNREHIICNLQEKVMVGVRLLVFFQQQKSNESSEIPLTVHGPCIDNSLQTLTSRFIRNSLEFGQRHEVAATGICCWNNVQKYSIVVLSKSVGLHKVVVNSHDHHDS